jgi:cytochrome c-type biogenesis protein CcmH/NrfG
MQAVLRAEPGFAEAWFALATLARDQGDREQAAWACRELLRLAPDHPQGRALERELKAGR